MSSADIEHGTNSSYIQGCRCDLCKLGHANYQRLWRSRQPKTETERKKYNRVNTTQPPQTTEEWVKLDADEFWFWMFLMNEDHRGFIPLPQDRKYYK